MNHKPPCPWITKITLPMDDTSHTTHESHKSYCPWITQITLPLNHTNHTTFESHKSHCPWITQTTLPMNKTNLTTPDDTNYTSPESHKPHYLWLTHITLPMSHTNHTAHESHKSHYPSITQITLPINHTNQTFSYLHIRTTWEFSCDILTILYNMNSICSIKAQLCRLQMPISWRTCICIYPCNGNCHIHIWVFHLRLVFSEVFFFQSSVFHKFIKYDAM